MFDFASLCVFRYVGIGHGHSHGGDFGHSHADHSHGHGEPHSDCSDKSSGWKCAKSLNMLATFLHVLSDFLRSIVVLVISIVIYYGWTDRPVELDSITCLVPHSPLFYIFFVFVFSPSP